MKEPGLDKRHRNRKSPKAGEIDQKHGNTLNKNLAAPIPQFPPNETLADMRRTTGGMSVESVRKKAAKLL